jgi:hypothetical protein
MARELRAMAKAVREGQPVTLYGAGQLLAIADHLDPRTPGLLLYETLTEGVWDMVGDDARDRYEQVAAVLLREYGGQS